MGTGTDRMIAGQKLGAVLLLHESLHQPMQTQAAWFRQATTMLV